VPGGGGGPPALVGVVVGVSRLEGVEPLARQLAVGLGLGRGPRLALAVPVQLDGGPGGVSAGLGGQRRPGAPGLLAVRGPVSAVNGQAGVKQPPGTLRPVQVEVEVLGEIGAAFQGGQLLGW
jgi:hypothetical protein